ncbi:MAG: hypothetical protein QOG41_1839, partial [Thermoleophilaceae bacterium]|nr:hypothetical protein [Thermoleophilaceae bacterium]
MFTERGARTAIARSRCWADALRLLGYSPRGGNPRTLQRYAVLWGISTDHFDPDAVRRDRSRGGPRKPLAQILVDGSGHSRDGLKRRLYSEGVKKRKCEMCGQGELWRGQRMALILDHVNGKPTDNRLVNLRILCPNCAATLDTHCGRKNRPLPMTRACKRCGEDFSPNLAEQKYCSRTCGQRASRGHGPRPHKRKVVRPPYGRLLREIAESNYAAVGRRYGVSDNAVRKWVKQYEAEIARRRSREPDA